MRLKGKIDAAVSVQRSWAFLSDLHEFATCAPGLESIEQVDDDTFRGVIGTSVGPIAGRFAFQARIVERRPEERMAVAVDGTESTTGSRLGATVVLTLAPAGADRTSLAYDADVALAGRLAILGEIVIRATAGVLLDEFGERMRRHLERPSLRAGGASSPGAPTGEGLPRATTASE